MQRALIQQAIDFLESSQIERAMDLDPDCAQFLIDTGNLIEAAKGLEFSQHRPVGIALLRLMLNLKTFFPVSSPFAQGLYAFGGQIEIPDSPNADSHSKLSSVSGAGLSPGGAINSCLGEAAERLSLYETKTEGLFSREDCRPNVIGLDQSTNQAKTDTLIVGGDCASGEEVAFSADQCGIDFPDRANGPLVGTGTGAGPSLASAILHGLLELVERDAFALWWIGGRPGRPIDLSAPTLVSANRILRCLRRGNTSRRTWLLDISGDLSLPCIAAVSANEEGLEVAGGTSCHPEMGKAVESALTEMCLMEISHEVAKAKLDVAGAESLNSIDERHLVRAETLDAKACPLLYPQGLPKYYASGNNDQPPEKSIKMVASYLQSIGISTYFINLTSPLVGVPAAKCLSPELQLYPFKQRRGRLETCIEEFGGGFRHSRGVMLY